jgi:hypothetical protein
MYMIGQYNPTADIEGVRVFNLADDFTQKINMQDQQIIVLPLPQVYCENSLILPDNGIGDNSASRRLPWHGLIRNTLRHCALCLLSKGVNQYSN